MEQARRGHAVGVLADASTGNALTDRQLRLLEPHLQLGLHRTKMSRLPSVSDLATVRETQKLVQKLRVDVAHGHGAKGGLYARLGAKSVNAGARTDASRAIGHVENVCTDGDTNSVKTRDQVKSKPVPGAALRIYTPHGGSLHYANHAVLGPLFLGMEAILQRFTDGLIFESVYARNTYFDHIGEGNAGVCVVPNGLRREEFVDVPLHKDAADFVFIGELRKLKGIDVLLRALAMLKDRENVRLAIVGDGPDRDEFETLAEELSLQTCVSFLGVMPAQKAFAHGHIVVVPSRAESFPYVVLEAAAAGKPLIATHVGGVPEIVWGTKMKLVRPDDVDGLSQAMQRALVNPRFGQDQAIDLRQKVAKKFTVEGMAGSVVKFYSDLLNS